MQFSGEADLGALEEALASGAGDLLHTGDLHSYLANDGLWPQEQEDRLFFPTLTEQQRKFAVNPGYPEYRAEVFGDLDAVSEGRTLFFSMSNKAISFPTKIQMIVMTRFPKLHSSPMTK